MFKKSKKKSDVSVLTEALTHTPDMTEQTPTIDDNTLTNRKKRKQEEIVEQQQSVSSSSNVMLDISPSNVIATEPVTATKNSISEVITSIWSPGTEGATKKSKSGLSGAIDEFIGLCRETDINVDRPTVCNFLLDYEIETVDSDGEQFVLVSLEDWRQYTSCVVTAKRLFDDFAAEDSQEENLASMGDLSNLVGRLPDEGNHVICVNFGEQHGFLLCSRNGSIQIIQSFANSSPLIESLDPDSVEHRIYDRDKLAETMQDIQKSCDKLIAAVHGKMSDSEVLEKIEKKLKNEERLTKEEQNVYNSMDEMFGGFVNICAAAKVRCAEMQSDQRIAENLRQKMADRLEKVKERVNKKKLEEEKESVNKKKPVNKKKRVNTKKNKK